jgi:Tfp pilus assembly PilM family ATPase
MSFLGRLFSKGSQRCVGIDFGSSELKAVQFAASARGPVLEHVYKVPTPANSIKDGVVTDPPLVGEALRQLITEGPLSFVK